MTPKEILTAIHRKLTKLQAVDSQQRWLMPSRQKVDVDFAQQFHMVGSNYRTLFGKDATQAMKMAHSRLLQRMEADGLIERPSARYVALTAAGRELIGVQSAPAIDDTS